MNRTIIPILKAQNTAYGRFDLSFLTTLIKKHHIKHILDIGTGEGSFILELAKKAPEVKIVAVDASRELINSARRNKKLMRNKQVIFDRCSFDETFSLDGFDLITARFVIEHVNDVDDLIEAVFQKLRSGGLFAVIEYHIDDGNTADPVWKEFRKREMALYKKLKSHPRLGTALPLLLHQHEFKNISSSLLQISPSTIGAKPFYRLVKTSGRLYARLDPDNWPKNFVNKLNRWCNEMSKRDDAGPTLFLVHTVGQKPS